MYNPTNLKVTKKAPCKASELGRDVGSILPVFDLLNAEMQTQLVNVRKVLFMHLLVLRFPAKKC